MPEYAGTMYDAKDIEDNRIISALAYILFFLPLIVCPQSPFGKFHANQGLILLIVAVAGSIVFNLLPLIGWILSMIYGFLILAMVIFGLLNTLQGQAKPLPLIGGITILK